MSLDRRTTPATDRVALERLRGILDRPAYTAGEAARVIVPLTDICTAPAGPRDRQMLLGRAVTVVDREGGWAFIEDENLFCGWVDEADIGPAPAPTHRVAVPAAHVYASPDIKQRPLARLSLGARVAVAGIEGDWAALETGGHIPAVHLDAQPAPDAPGVARLLIGTPYVWGGNSRDGIDCSGLVQLSLNACGVTCPGDSDLQRAIGQEASGPHQPGDLFFWPGHVAMALDSDTMIHATAFGMAVITEPIATCRARIEATLPLLTIRRP